MFSYFHVCGFSVSSLLHSAKVKVAELCGFLKDFHSQKTFLVVRGFHFNEERKSTQSCQVFIKPGCHPLYVLDMFSWSLFFKAKFCSLKEKHIGWSIVPIAWGVRFGDYQTCLKARVSEETTPPLFSSPSA